MANDWSKLPPEIASRILHESCRLTVDPQLGLPTVALNSAENVDYTLLRCLQFVCRGWSFECRVKLWRHVFPRTDREALLLRGWAEKSSKGGLPLPFASYILSVQASPSSAWPMRLTGHDAAQKVNSVQVYWSEMAALLSHLPQVEAVNIRSIDVSSPAFERMINVIGTLEHLTTLTLSAGVSLFNKAHHLTYSLSPFFDRLSHASNLNKLNISFRGQDVTAPSTFLLHNITVAKLSYVPANMDSVITYLSGFPAMQSLDLSEAHNRFEDADRISICIGQMADLPIFASLRHLQISIPHEYNVIGTIFLQIPLPRLTSLRIAASEYYDRDYDIFTAMAGANMPLLGDFTLVGNETYPAQGRTIDAMLFSKQLPVLRTVTLVLMHEQFANHRNLERSDHEAMSIACRNRLVHFSLRDPFGRPISWYESQHT